MWVGCILFPSGAFYGALGPKQTGSATGTMGRREVGGGAGCITDSGGAGSGGAGGAATSSGVTSMGSDSMGALERNLRRRWRSARALEKKRSWCILLNVAKRLSLGILGLHAIYLNQNPWVDVSFGEFTLFQSRLGAFR